MLVPRINLALGRIATGIKSKFNVCGPRHLVRQSSTLLEVAVFADPLPDGIEATVAGRADQRETPVAGVRIIRGRHILCGRQVRAVTGRNAMRVVER